MVFEGVWHSKGVFWGAIQAKRARRLAWSLDRKT